MSEPSVEAPALRLLHALERRRARAALFGRQESLPVCVGRFELRRVLGQGASGVVFRAWDPALDRDVAVKVLGTGARPRPVADEARLLAAVSDPHVVPVFEVGDEAGATFVVMEYVAGTTLQRWLADGPSATAVRDAFLDVARGLAACHRRGVVHGDFKPANVMIGEDGRPRVVDFGLALRTGHPPGPTGGTPSYMAPEVRAGAPPSAASDVFSFCVALGRALGGRASPEGAVDAARIRPRSLGRLVQDGLRSRPEDRPADAAALVARMQASSPPSKRWPWVAATALLALVGATFATRSTQDPRFEGVPAPISRPGAPTVLWIDDNPRYNAKEIAALHRRGYDVRLAVTLEEADRYGGYGGYALVISDLERHDESGFDDDAGFRVIRRVRADGAAVPVVLYTADRLVPVLTASVTAAGGAAITGNRQELLLVVDRLAQRPGDRAPGFRRDEGRRGR